MKYLWIIALLLAISAPCAAQHTYYISKSLAGASDSNTSAQARSKSTPWQHFPGMYGCTGNCASYSPVAGDQFILYGGDTWGSSDLGVNWTWNGSNGSPIYIGVDMTWYTGGAWARPIFNCGGANCDSITSSSVVWIGGDYVKFDNVEITGVEDNANINQIVGVLATNSEIEHLYIHNITRTSGDTGHNTYAYSLNLSDGATAVLPGLFHDNYIDNSDSANQDFMAGLDSGDQVYNNVIRYVYNGMNGSFDTIYDNLVEDNYAAVSGDHCNLIFVQAITSGSLLLVFDNVIDQKLSSCSGGSTVWLIGNGGSACTGCVTYAFNNVIYDVSNNFNPTGFITAGHQASGNQGTFYIFSNTIAPIGTGNCMGDGETGASLATVDYNSIHCVTSAAAICLNTDATCNDGGGELLQTQTAANGDGYTDSQTYAFSPTTGSSPTVGAGINNQSYCTALQSLYTAAYDACLYDVNYPSADTSNHTVQFSRTIVLRPASAAWDIGAYEYAGAGPTPPASAAAPSLFASKGAGK